MRLWLLYINSILFVSCSVQTPQMDLPINWQSDIEFVRINLPKEHKNLFFKRDKNEFDASLDKIILQKDKLSDFVTAIKLQQVIASMGDSHTSIGWQKLINENKRLPIELYWFSDGIYIIKASKNYKNLLGKKINEINNQSISKIISSLSTLITVDNQAIVKRNIPYLITIPQVLEYYDFSNNGIFELEVESLEGEITSEVVIPTRIDKNEWINVKTDSIAYSWQDTKTPFREIYFARDSIYYIQYNSCVSKFMLYLTGNWEQAKRTPSFGKFKKKIFKTIKEKHINKLIFDMQFNSGGSSIQGTKFVKDLANVKNINQKGKLYVIIGRKTFSSAIINTLDFKENTEAILVGEETGGKPNHYGEVKNLILPSSKLKLYYSTKYFKRTEKELNTITPDIEAETSFKEYIRGIDPVFDWIKKK